MATMGQAQLGPSALGTPEPTGRNNPERSDSLAWSPTFSQGDVQLPRLPCVSRTQPPSCTSFSSPGLPPWGQAGDLGVIKGSWCLSTGVMNADFSLHNNPK